MPTTLHHDADVVRVVLVDDYEIARWGFQHMCEAFPHIECIAVFEGGKPAVEFCKTHPVDVLMLDLLMPGMNGIETALALSKLDHPPKIIVLTAHHKLEFLKATIDAGVRGYLLKTVAKEEIEQAIHQVHQGGVHFCPKVQSDLLSIIKGNHGISPDVADVSELLTPQEFKILQHIAKGLSNKDLADRLYVSPRTIETHKRNIRRKLQLGSARKLYGFALKYFGNTP